MITSQNYNKRMKIANKTQKKTINTYHFVSNCRRKVKLRARTPERRRRTFKIEVQQIIRFFIGSNP